MLPSWEVVIHDASLLLSPQGSLTVAPFLGAPRRLSFTMPPFLPSPQISLSDAPFLGAQRGNQSPLLLVGIGSCLGTDPRALPYPVAIPGKLVRPSNESSWGLAIQRVRTLVHKRTRNTIRWYASSFFSGFLHCTPAEPTVQ